jgi:pyruvate, water dikinase
MTYCIPFSKLSLTNLSQVGGKNSSLGEMISSMAEKGILVPDGYAINADAYNLFLSRNKIHYKLTETLRNLDTTGLNNLSEIGKVCRDLISSGTIPAEVENEIRSSYQQLLSQGTTRVAVRSSATAEDLPSASFAGQHDSFLNIEGEQNLLRAVKRCYISLFNDRAIKYRVDHGFEHMQVALSVGIQMMVNADKGSAGVAFTVDPETGFENAIYITSAWGLGENVVQGAVNPDEFYLFKPTLKSERNPIIKKVLGSKEHTMIYSGNEQFPVVSIPTPSEQAKQYSILDHEVVLLGKWCYEIEQHYGMPMDIEWAKDGLSGQIYILQARPETVHARKQNISMREYHLNEKPEPLCRGKAVGRSIVTGTARIIHALEEEKRVESGDIIVADITNPDWNSLLRRAVSIVTNRGGRTSHASIVARELGIHAVVGTHNATQKIRDGQTITVSCIEGDEGHVYDGKLKWEEKEIFAGRELNTVTSPMFILADPDQAFRLSAYPNKGVGLLRMEFIIAQSMGVHPMALLQFEKLSSPEKEKVDIITAGYASRIDYFTGKLSQSIAMVGAAFYPNDVIVRMSDFKTNEYAKLAGGSQFEPDEENPMLGFRGASRYYHDRYKNGFGLECKAIRRARDEMGLTNIKVMIPFCRTVDEGERVLEVMKEFGLTRGQNNLEVYVMMELPSNAILANDFAEIFDGFSIGSNDLTQLTLGIDRDSSLVSDLFDENNEAVLKLIREIIRAAKRRGIPVGLCGQAPSDHPRFTELLVREGIDSISFNPDALLKGIENIRKAEAELAVRA